MARSDGSMLNSDSPLVLGLERFVGQGCASASVPGLAYHTYSQIAPKETLGLRKLVDIQYTAKFCAGVCGTDLSKHLGSIDKQFAVTWLNQDTVVWGTKCNKLLVHHITTGNTKQIPLVPVPQHIQRPRELDNKYGKCGMHAVAINPSRTLLACGGDHPNDIMVYSLPDFKPVKTLLGHNDWVFGLNWLSDLHLASGGRDGKMKLWTVNQHNYHDGPNDLYTDNASAITATVAHKPGIFHILPLSLPLDNLERFVSVDLFPQSKVRETCYCPWTRELLALDPDGFVRQLDTVAWEVAKKWELPDKEELVCITSSYHLMAAGTCKNLVLMDTRAPASAGVLVPHVDDEGLRSVRINKGVVSCGGAYGTLTFFDLIAGKWATHDSLAPEPAPVVMHVGPATADREQVEANAIVHYALLDDQLDYMSHCAVYCHEWDVSGRMLIAGGGPLAIGLRGCHAALWR